MATLHQFGGNWTEEKLVRLRKYLSAYMIIFKRNQWAKRYTTTYVDAFAGTGSRLEQNPESPSTLSLFEALDVTDVERFYAGSARIALEVEPSFDQFIFVEQKSEYVRELEQLRQEYPSKSEQSRIEHGDANEFLQKWCREMDWHRNRAIVFLDPYGMAVDWSTIEAIAGTKAIDLWILLPVGQAINRLLTRQSPPGGAWADKLTRFFGTDQWENAFYDTYTQSTLFGDIESFEKKANFEIIGNFFVKRLETVFGEVAQNSLALLNSRNNPLFILYFASAYPTAVNIAGDILGR